MGPSIKERRMGLLVFTAICTQQRGLNTLGPGRLTITGFLCAPDQVSESEVGESHDAASLLFKF